MRNQDDPFLASWEWRTIRMRVLERDGAKCACCGVTAREGARMNVDHIKPRRHYPELALTLSNLQVLCEECNHGKGNRYETDWRGGKLVASATNANSQLLNNFLRDPSMATLGLLLEGLDKDAINGAPILSVTDYCIAFHKREERLPDLDEIAARFQETPESTALYAAGLRE